MSGPSGDLELAEGLAREAGRLLSARYGEPVEGLRSKSSGTDMVSEADNEAERAVARGLASARPDDGVLGEEGTSSGGSSGRRWIVDPLDGTTNFLYGIPAWSVSIALEDGQGLLVAVVHSPCLNETYTAERGAGCRLNGAAVRVRPPAPLSAALVATGFAYGADQRAAQVETLRRVLPRVRDVRRAGSAALDLAWVAAGRLDGYWEMGISPWDWAGGALLVTEAGGAIRVLDGDPPGLLAATPALMEPLAGLVAG